MGKGYKDDVNNGKRAGISNNEGGYGGENNDEKIVNAESLNIDGTLKKISADLKSGETLILDIGNNYFHQTDEIYDTLVTKGYDVKKSFRDGRNQIIVSRQPPQL